MSAFIYFIPEKQTVNFDDVRNAGIKVFNSADSIGYCGVNSGPGGNPGCVFAVQPEIKAGKLPKIGYYKDKQKWAECDNGAYWIGIEKDVLPIDLQKKDIIQGHEVKLGDDNKWIIPLARFIPQTIGFENGEPIYRPKNKFSFLQEIAEKTNDWIYGAVEGEEQTIKDNDLIKMACDVLAVNYRIGTNELNVLGLLDTDNIQEILASLVDFKSVIEAAESKKKQEEGDNMNFGEKV